MNVRSEGTILVVDDETRIRSIINRRLKSQGYEVVEAEDGEGTLEKLREQNFDVVLLDIYLPGKNGLEVLAEARKSGCQSAFIIITAYGSVELAVKAMQNGARDFIEKLYLSEQLLEKVEKFCVRLQENPVVIYVREHCHEIKCREDAARALDLAVETVARRIARVTGQTFDEFLYHCRMEKARKLLESSRLNISQIAYKTGFSTPEFFARVCKRELKMSPKEYRMFSKVRQNGL